MWSIAEVTQNVWSRALGEVLMTGAVLVAMGCSSGQADVSRVVATTFAPIDPVTDVLTAADVDLIVQAAAESNDAQNLAIAVTDRIGNILRVWNRNLATHPGFDCENNIATSIARAAAYLSHSQAPLTSRTGQFLSTFHFPPVFDVGTYDPMLGLDCAPVRPTLGVTNTPQGPLWQIDASNRGTPIESAATNPPTAFDPGKAIPILANPDSSVPSPGLTALPGGVPLYKRTTASGFDVGRRLVGAVGVYSTDGSGDPQPELAEFAALTGAQQVDPNTGQPYLFQPMIPFEGAVFLVGHAGGFPERDVPLRRLLGVGHDGAEECSEDETDSRRELEHA